VRPADYPAEGGGSPIESSAAGDGAAAAEALGAASWIQRTALPNVPDEFKDSFLNRNPVNRSILTTASRRLPKP
jgi:hypothetical protein